MSAAAAADEAALQRYLRCPEAAVYRPAGDVHPFEAQLWRICRRRAVEAAGGVG